MLLLCAWVLYLPLSAPGVAEASAASSISLQTSGCEPMSRAGLLQQHSSFKASACTVLLLLLWRGTWNCEARQDLQSSNHKRRSKVTIESSKKGPSWSSDHQGREHPGDHLAPSRVAPLLVLQVECSRTVLAAYALALPAVKTRTGLQDTQSTQYSNCRSRERPSRLGKLVTK